MVFSGRRDLLNILLIFICGHLVITLAAPITGMELQTVHNARFFPVLAILPALYLGLMILGRHRFTKKVLLCTIVQAAILMFVIHIRTSAKYQVIFLTMVFVSASFWLWINNPKIGKLVFKKVLFWPLAIVLLGFFIMKIHLALNLQYPYTTATEKKHFWYTIYAGLGAHPDSLDKYGITYDDPSTLGAAETRIIEKYGTRISFDPGILESILKKEFFKLFKEDPGFVIESYLYKFPLFVKSYFSPSFGAIAYLFNPLLLIIVITGSLLAGNVGLKRWREYFLLLIMGFSFSMIPALLSMPIPALIADPALFFTMLIYIIISTVSYYSINRLLIAKTKKRSC